ncbi:ABC-2 family transporter protein [Peptostreptococcaceae bacterium AGR-M142]
MRYLDIYFSIFKINLKNDLINWQNFLMNLIDSLIWFLLIIFFYESIFGIKDKVNGWSKDEILILVATSEIIKSIVFALFIENLPSIPRMIIKGDLDNYLLKPIDSRFLISVFNIDFGNLGSILPALYLLFYSISSLNNKLYLSSILIYIIFIIIAVILSYSLWISIMTLSFFILKGTSIHEFFMGALTLTRYPKDIFKKGLSFLLTVIFPILLVSNIPANILKNNAVDRSVISFVLITIIYYIISKLFWNIAIRRYESASK